MKILVATKRVLDYNVRPLVKADGSGVETANVKMSMNPFDEVAVEAAVRLREAGHASEIVAVSIGPAKCEETLRIALAMGADRAVLVATEDALQPLAVAKVLRALVHGEKPDLVLTGRQAIDDDANQTGQMLAGMLDWPQATFASRLTLEGGKARIVREIDGGTEVVLADLPLVVTADLRLSEPRLVSLPNQLKARKKPLAQTSPEALGVDVTPRLRTLQVQEPAKRAAGVRVDSVAELVRCLHDEAGVI
jgi:electron transfer flavoprotein beta subunit